MRSFLLLLATAVLAVSGQTVRYDNYEVYRVVPETTQQVRLLQNLEDTAVELSLWKTSRKVDDPSDVLVPPHKRQFFHDIINEAKLNASVMIPNVQELMDHEGRRMSGRSAQSMDWTSYYPLEEIHTWLEELAEANSNVEVVTAGKSYEGREIKGIEITNGENLPGIIFESGIHAREWIAPAATSWMINEIINSDSDSIWKQFNYLYLPIVNPDGYVYTWEKDRAWRKTRVPHKAGLITCYGADPNRNWDFHWMEGGATNNPCSETYAGPTAFSEPEVKSLADYLSSVSSKYDIYVAFHSYSQLLMYPWGYTGQDTPLEATWKRIGNAAAADLKAVHGMSFEVGSIYDTIYQASGSSIEWYYGMYNSTLTFVFELRDTGKYGFVLPPEQIIPSGEELIAAVERFATEYQKLPAKPKKESGC